MNYLSPGTCDDVNDCDDDNDNNDDDHKANTDDCYICTRNISPELCRRFKAVMHSQGFFRYAYPAFSRNKFR